MTGCWSYYQPVLYIHGLGSLALLSLHLITIANVWEKGHHLCVCPLIPVFSNALADDLCVFLSASTSVTASINIWCSHWDCKLSRNLILEEIYGNICYSLEIPLLADGRDRQMRQMFIAMHDSLHCLHRMLLENSLESAIHTLRKHKNYRVPFTRTSHFKNSLYCYVCHIRHIRPHSPFPIPSLPPSRQSPHLSLDCPSVLCLCPCCWPSCTCVTQLTLVPAHRFWIDKWPFIHSSRHYRHYIDWLESEIRLLNRAAAVQLLLRTHITTGQFLTCCWSVYDIATTTLEDV